MLEEPRRLSTQLRAELATDDADKIDDSAILGVEQRLMTLAEAIAARYFLQGAASRPRRESHGPRVIYDVRHLTRYRYDAPVAANACTLRLLPRSIDGQNVMESRIDVTPHPKRMERARRHLRQPRRAHAHRDAASRTPDQVADRRSTWIVQRRPRPA